MRPQHRHVISDVSGVGRPSADVDEGGAAVVGVHDMPGRHLGRALRGCASRPWIAEPRIACDDVAWLDENVTVRITRPHALATHERKRIGIELVIGQNHEILEVLRIGARVMVQTMQRIIDASCAKKGKRHWRPWRRPQSAVDDSIIHCREIWRVEEITQRSVKGSRDVDVSWIGEVNRNRLVRFADLNCNSVILNEQPNLLCQISVEEVGPGYSSLVRTRATDKTVGQTGIKPGMSGRHDTDKWICGTHA